ncbi:MAG: hypothetical protein SGARI_003651 [Bacillariaceae sp.]
MLSISSDGEILGNSEVLKTVGRSLSGMSIKVGKPEETEPSFSMGNLPRGIRVGISDALGAFDVLGVADGAPEGEELGELDGVPDGAADGIKEDEGLDEGAPLGEALGVPLGALLGLDDGDPLGLLDGVPLGCKLFEGSWLGNCEGC